MLKIHIGKVWFLILAVAVTFTGCGDSDSTVAQRLQQSVDDNWIPYKQQYGISSGGLAVYIEAPNGNYFVSSGMPAAVDKNTRFRVASNTKTFTAAAVMLLHQQGKLNIDDTIVSNIPGTATPYLPDTAPYAIPYKNSITIRQLLSHTAGVWDVNNQPPIPLTCPVPYAGKTYPEYIMNDLGDVNHQFTLEELIGVVATCQISYWPPGTGYHYSNTGYSILAKIIERVSGAAYDVFIRQNLLAPNRLESTTVPMLASERTIPAPYSEGFVFEGGVLKPWTEDNMSVTIAEGNIISTQADLTRWIRRLMNGEAGINAANVALMKTPTAHSASYGLGIMNAGGGLGYGHNGAHAGFLSLMIYNPADDVSVVLYFNVLDFTNIGKQFALLTKVAQEAKKVLGYQ